MVSWGPAPGDLENWNYETVDTAPYLKKGENIIASQVWNMGILKGPIQISIQTAFLMQGESKFEQLAKGIIKDLIPGVALRGS